MWKLILNTEDVEALVASQENKTKKNLTIINNQLSHPKTGGWSRLRKFMLMIREGTVNVPTKETDASLASSAIDFDSVWANTNSLSYQWIEKDNEEEFLVSPLKSLHREGYRYIILKRRPTGSFFNAGKPTDTPDNLDLNNETKFRKPPIRISERILQSEFIRVDHVNDGVEAVLPKPVTLNPSERLFPPR